VNRKKSALFYPNPDKPKITNYNSLRLKTHDIDQLKLIWPQKGAKKAQK